MILAVIARSLDATPTGRGTVGREYVRAIRRVRSDIGIELFAGADPDWDGVNFHPVGGGILPSVWHMGWGVGTELKELRPHAVWCATHLLPRGVPADVPTIVTLLDVVWRDKPHTLKLRQRLTARYGERGLHRADQIVCISEFTRGRLLHYWPELAPRAIVIHIAPRSSLVRQHNPNPMESTRPVVVSVGTLEPRKNLSVVLDAMERLPDIKLVHAGTQGWNIGHIVSRAAGMSNVKLLGYVDENTVHSLYANATVAAFPSVYEGFDLPPLEAMVVGCPVVASDIPVHREILGDAAMFVPADDADAWAHALQRVVDDGAYRAHLVAAGRAQAARYSWDTAARELTRVIDDALAKKRAR